MALTFDITYGSRVPLAARKVVAAVTSSFSSEFSDPVTLNITVKWGHIGGLGTSSFSLTHSSYDQIVNALAADARTTDDASAVAALPSSDPISGPHSWSITTAEAKALGLINGHAGWSDGTITFSNAALFDFNDSNGVSRGRVDFYGVVAHEITEVMGRELSNNATSVAAGGTYHPLDLFKYASPGIHTFAGTTAGYFSLDDGATNLANFNTNPNGDFGDWASGIHDSFLAFSPTGVLNPVSSFDLSEMDAIGWDRANGTQAQVAAVSNHSLRASSTVSSSMSANGAVDEMHCHSTTSAVLTGTAAGDSFNFAAVSGKTTITDFDPRHDVIEIDHSQFANFAAVMAHASDDGHGDVVIAHDPHHTVTLQNVSLAQLHAGDFHFV
jgi:hypothetical protein